MEAAPHKEEMFRLNAKSLTPCFWCQEDRVRPPSAEFAANIKKGGRKPNVEHGVQVLCCAEHAYGGVHDVLNESRDASCVCVSTEQANGGP